MLDVPADVPPLLVALSLASTALLGVVFATSPAPSPREAPLADTVDTVAAADTPGVETRAVDVPQIRIESQELAVSGPGGTSHASFAYGPVVPVHADTPLWRVLRGTPPDEVFESQFAFANAAAAASTRDAQWRRGVDRLTVRGVNWGGVDVTLVGA